MILKVYNFLMNLTCQYIIESGMKTFAVLFFIMSSVALFGAESQYVLDVQYASDSNDTFHVVGSVTEESITAYLEKFRG
jgi:hypothetical protein